MIPRRPENERTRRNKNIAISYALHTIYSKLASSYSAKVQLFLNDLGLDPTDDSLDLATPIGIGNFAALKVYEARMSDGMNELGDWNGKKYNRIPFEDYTNYVPFKEGELKNAGHWSPPTDYENGMPIERKYSFPQLRLVKPYFLENISKLLSTAPSNSNPSNSVEYKKQVDEILKQSAELNDYKKMATEHFENNFQTFSMAELYLAKKYSLSQDELVGFMFLSNAVKFDSIIFTSNEKMKYLSVRPTSAIRYLYENSTIHAWGGVGVGTVSDITGKEWRSYIRVSGANGEYPSLRACLCSSVFSFHVKFFGSNDFGFSTDKPKGSSVVEPGITPTENIQLGPFVTLDDYLNECAISRVWGGVHFMASTEEGKRLCKKIGEDYFEVANQQLKV
jgi:hypothetical protein